MQLTAPPALPCPLLDLVLQKASYCTSVAGYIMAPLVLGVQHLHHPELLLGFLQLYLAVPYPRLHPAHSPTRGPLLPYIASFMLMQCVCAQRYPVQACCSSSHVGELCGHLYFSQHRYRIRYKPSLQLVALVAMSVSCVLRPPLFQPTSISGTSLVCSLLL